MTGDVDALALDVGPEDLVFEVDGLGILSRDGCGCALGALRHWDLRAADRDDVVRRALFAYSGFDPSLLYPGQGLEAQLPLEGVREARRAWEHFSTHGRDDVYGMASAIAAYLLWQRAAPDAGAARRP